MTRHKLHTLEGVAVCGFKVNRGKVFQFGFFLFDGDEDTSRKMGESRDSSRQSTVGSTGAEQAALFACARTLTPCSALQADGLAPVGSALAYMLLAVRCRLPTAS